MKRNVLVLGIALVFALGGCSGNEEDVVATGTHDSYYVEINGMMESFLSMQSEFLEISTVFVENPQSEIHQAAFVAVVKDLAVVMRESGGMAPPSQLRNEHSDFVASGEAAAIVLDEMAVMMEEGVDFSTLESIELYNDLQARNVETATHFADCAYGLVEEIYSGEPSASTLQEEA